MAQTMTNKGKALNANGTVVFGTTTLKMGLIQGATGETLSADYPTALDPDRNFVSDLLGIVTEATATGYSRGTLGTVTVTEDDTNDRANIDAANQVFSAIGGGTNNFIIGCWIEGPGANDAARPVIAVYELNEVATNGSDITVTISDFLRLS